MVGETAVRALCGLRFRKVDPKSIFVMTFDNTFSCNPAPIVKELLERKNGLRIVWAFTGDEAEARKCFPEGVTLVRRGSTDMFREQACAKVWLDNGINCLWFGVPKKKEQVYINTWHGSLGIKKYSGDELWKKIAARAADTTDYCITNSTFEENIFRGNLWPKSKMLPFGHARNDILFRTEEHDSIRREIFAQLGITPEEKLFLYAPTFRDDGDTSWMTLDLEQLKKNLEKRFGGTWKIALRFHFKDRTTKQWLPQQDEDLHEKNEAASSDNCAESGFISANGISDMYRLMIAADAGCSDYSSWIYDYLFLKRPAFLYVPDLLAYNAARGFTYPIETTPFPRALTNEEMEERILGFDENEFAQAKEAFLKEKGCYEDGGAEERCADFIESVCCRSKA